MWPLSVVVLDVFGQDRYRLTLVEDQHPVGQFRSDGTYEPFRVAVCLRAMRRIGTTSISASPSTASNATVNWPARSRTIQLNESRFQPSAGITAVAVGRERQPRTSVSGRGIEGRHRADFYPVLPAPDGHLLPTNLWPATPTVVLPSAPNAHRDMDDLTQNCSRSRCHRDPIAYANSARVNLLAQAAAQWESIKSGRRHAATVGGNAAPYWRVRIPPGSCHSGDTSRLRQHALVLEVARFPAVSAANADGGAAGGGTNTPLPATAAPASVSLSSVNLCNYRARLSPLSIGYTAVVITTDCALTATTGPERAASPVDRTYLLGASG